jgi:hypothetical protein
VGKAGEEAAARDFLCRSDLRVGDFGGGAGFRADAGVDLVRGGAAGPDTERDAVCFMLALVVPFACAGLVAVRALLFAGSGGGSLLTREDLRTPLEKMVVGPSAAKDLQGGDTARDSECCGVRSASTLRRLDGRSVTTPWPFWVGG